jgi:hypothetical protein
MLEGIKITWYGWMLIGFGVGVYLHFSYARHAIHWLIIQVLRGVIWLLHKTDPLYREPKKITPKPDKAVAPPARDYSKNGVEVSDAELAQYLKNPAVSVAKR